MTTYIFTGPTLGAEQVHAELDAVVLPPCGQGDVYRLTRQLAPGERCTIGIIDGYFERVPAVWHKEILWAMSRGVHVFGSASMGALRAAELAAFGMVGVGSVYERFHVGELEDDDEVAVAHGPADTGYRALSEAMVNVRATLAAAEARGVIRAKTRAALAALAKDTYYAERSYPVLLSRASERGLAADELEDLRAFVTDPSGGRVAHDQKRADALAMLRAIAEHLAGDPGPKQVDYAFERTDAWQQFTSRFDPDTVAAPGDERALEGEREAVREELALCGEYVEIRRQAMLRVLGLDRAERHGFSPGREALEVAAATLGRRHGWAHTEEVRAWLERQGLARERLEDILADEAKLAWVERIDGPRAERAIDRELRVLGRHGDLAERARRRQDALRRAGLERPTLADASIDEAGLWAWYFEGQLARPVPANLGDYARHAGFGDLASLRRCVLRALCHERLQRQPCQAHEG